MGELLYKRSLILIDVLGAAEYSIEDNGGNREGVERFKMILG